MRLRILAMALALCLCLGACGSAPGESTVSIQSENTSDASPSSNFTKLKLGYFTINDFGVFALDTSGDLYFGTDQASFAVVETNVRDFSCSGRITYVLKENGDLLKYPDDSQIPEIVYHDDSIVGLSASVLIMPDGSIISYRFNDDSWNRIDAHAVSVDAEYFGAAFIDENGTLWHLDRLTLETEKVAENVTIYAYGDRDELNYFDYIWYFTKSGEFHVWEKMSPDEPTITDISLSTQDFVAVYGGAAFCALQRENGGLCFYSIRGDPCDIDEGTLLTDFMSLSFAYMDCEEEIHIGYIDVVNGENVIVEKQTIIPEME